MIIKVDTAEKYHALVAALDQYTMNNECGDETDSPEEFLKEYPYQEAAVEMLEDLQLTLIKSFGLEAA